MALIIKYRPILLNKAVDECLRRLVEMGKVKLRTEFQAVLGFVVDRKEGGVDIVEGRSGMLAFAKNATSVDAMEDDIEVVRLVGKPAIVIKDVWAFPTAFPRNNADRLWRRMKRRWVLATIIRRRPKDTPNAGERTNRIYID